jgi:hypothetical protein
VTARSPSHARAVLQRTLLLALLSGGALAALTLALWPLAFLVGSWIVTPFVWYSVDTHDFLPTIFARKEAWITASVGLLLATALATALLTRRRRFAVSLAVMPLAYCVTAALTHAALWGLGFTSLVE